MDNIQTINHIILEMLLKSIKHYVINTLVSQHQIQVKLNGYINGTAVQATYKLQERAQGNTELTLLIQNHRKVLVSTEERILSIKDITALGRNLEMRLPRTNSSGNTPELELYIKMLELEGINNIAINEQFIGVLFVQRSPIDSINILATSEYINMQVQTRGKEWGYERVYPLTDTQKIITNIKNYQKMGASVQ